MNITRPPQTEADRLKIEMRRALGHLRAGQPEKAKGQLEKVLGERKGVK
jgi:Tfp pilus assembly protein PilF